MNDLTHTFMPTRLEPTLENLSFYLRNPDLWPKDFGPWDYSQYETCAIGLLKKIWPKLFLINFDIDIAKELNIDTEIFNRIFYRAIHLKEILGKVTPTDVADEIDKNLNGE